MYEHQSRQVDCGSADDGLLDEEAPDLGPLRKTAEAAELASPSTVKFHNKASRRWRSVSSWLTVMPAVSCPACSAASTISVSRRMSRCIDGPGFG